MEHRPFAGLDVPVIGMGTSKTFDVPAVDDARQQITDTALDAGATFVDSSPMYGHAERILGATLGRAPRRGDRGDQGVDARRRRGRAPDRRLARASSAGTSRCFQVHNLVEWRTRLDQLEAPPRRGRDRHRRRDPLAGRGVRRAGGRDAHRPRSAPSRCRTTRTSARSSSASCRSPQSSGIGVILMRPFAAGGLVGRQPVAPPTWRRWPSSASTTWPQALLKYGLSHPATTVSIPATTRPERMAENAAAGDGPWFGPDEKALVERLAG